MRRRRTRRSAEKCADGGAALRAGFTVAISRSSERAARPARDQARSSPSDPIPHADGTNRLSCGFCRLFASTTNNRRTARRRSGSESRHANSVPHPLELRGGVAAPRAAQARGPYRLGLEAAGCRPEPSGAPRHRHRPDRLEPHPERVPLARDQVVRGSNAHASRVNCCYIFGSSQNRGSCYSRERAGLLTSVHLTW
jgi:hypothetical protein